MANFRDDDFREQFRPPANVRFIHSLPKSMIEPGYKYARKVSYYRYDPYRMDRLLDEGWEFVWEEGTELNERSNATTDKENARRNPIKVVSKDGTVSYWMRIPLDRYQEIQKDKRLKREARLYQSINRKKHGSGYIHTDKEMYDPDSQQ